MAKTRLNLPRIEPKREAPFAEDKIGRKPLADRITRVLEDAEDAVVLAVDGGWGTGKSTFARMLQAHLDGRDFQTTYIDAFAVDYVEDPFVPIFARLQALIQQEKDLLDKSQDFLKKAARVLGVILGKASAAGVNMAAQAGLTALTGAPPPAIEKLGDKAAEAWEELAARRISGFLQEEQYIEDYKQALAATAQAYYDKHDKPLVILIDELDRCRPDFAVLFLERIKHFFEVPHLAFVLIIHRDQLEKSIRGCYGAEIDARTYLQKFISMLFEISPIESPRTGREWTEASSNRERFLKDHLHLCGWREQGNVSIAGRFVEEFDLSLREVERIIGMIAASGEGPKMHRKSDYVVEGFFILLILKIKDDLLFQQSLKMETFRFIFDPLSKFKTYLRHEENWENSMVYQALRVFNDPSSYFDGKSSFWEWVHKALVPQRL